MRVIEWHQDHIRVVDQTALPAELVHLDLVNVDDLVAAIVALKVRGAPLLGAAGALGVALAVGQARREGWQPGRLEAEIDRIRTARPTAVNLAHGVEAVLPTLPLGEPAILRAALTYLAGLGEAHRRIAENGAQFLRSRRDGPWRLHTHCNTGALACAEWGTALGVVRRLHELGQVTEVIVDETRPLLQGARLTTWELRELGIPHRLICDGAGPFVLAQGLVDAVIVGADRIAANGDVANKIGTYALALAAREAGVPFVVAAPEATIDPTAASAAAIPVEQRSALEVTRFAGVPTAPVGTPALNFAFDLTPARLISAIVTEERVVVHDQAVASPR